MGSRLNCIDLDTHNICLYKEVEKKEYTGYNLKTTELLDCALIGICTIIRSNTIIFLFSSHPFYEIPELYFQYI